VKHFFPEPVDASERALFSRVETEAARHELAQLTPEVICQLTSDKGCDFATVLLHRSIVESERHGPFLRRLSQMSNPRGPGSTIAIVPGAFYRENPRTGADGSIVREVAGQLGLPFVVAPVSSTGSVAENARLLGDWLSASGLQRLILVSVSKGGSDIKAALSHPDAKSIFERVIGWVNLCGILDGTPMADWLLSPNLLARANRFVYRIRGRSLDFLRDLRRVPGCALDCPLNLPAHLRVVHVIGFPLRRHLHNGLARRSHARLETFGPNDGAILLSDAVRWPGQLCPVWGADHYLRPREDVRPLLAALLRDFAS
jgi:hypothetical protein